ncbi:MAG: protein kinase [Pseudomonadota bacterium]
MAAPRSSDTFKIGDILNATYLIEAVLGQGGTGEVYRAKNEETGRVVAVKTLRARFAENHDYRALIRREEAIREVVSDAVVRYIDAGRTPEGHVYLLMDYVPGPSLYARMREGPVPVGDLMMVARRVAEGLAAAHTHEIIHRDLSPDNIILRNGDPERAVIIDFGIAKDTRPDAETIAHGGFAGKYQYAPPEQLRGYVDPRSDLYALGMSLLAAFRAATPDVGTNPVELVQRKAEAPDISGVPEPLGSIIAALTQPELDDRPESAAAVIAMLDRAGAPQPMTVTARHGPILPPAAPAMPQGAGAAPEAGADNDATVISRIPASAGGGAPPSAPRASEPMPWEEGAAAPAPPGSAPAQAPGAMHAAEKERPRRGGLYTLLALLLIGGGLGGAWSTGMLDPFFEPPLPLADPYRLEASLAPDGRLSATGHAPDESAALALARSVATIGAETRRARGAADPANPPPRPSEPDTVEIAVARGAPTEAWSRDMQAFLAPLGQLEDWAIDVTGREVAIAGVAPNGSARDRAAAGLERAAETRGYALETALRTGPRSLPRTAVETALAQAETCGPLSLTAPPETAYALDDRVAVTGRIAVEADRIALQERLASLLGERPLALGLEVLNRPLCEFLAHMPDHAASGMRFRLGYGDKPDENPTGAYAVGENPVIDLVVPAAESDGYLHVMLVDVSGQVFHLLPNNYRREHDVAELGAPGPGEGERLVRLAYPTREGGTRRADEIAFVIDETFGRTLVVAVRTAEPLFDEIRPIAESVASVADRLDQRQRDGALGPENIAIRMLDTRS